MIHSYAQVLEKELNSEKAASNCQVFIIDLKNLLVTFDFLPVKWILQKGTWKIFLRLFKIFDTKKKDLNTRDLEQKSISPCPDFTILWKNFSSYCCYWIASFAENI